MVRILSNWYGRWKFSKLSKTLLSKDYNDYFYRDVILWFEDLTKYVDVSKLYTKRFTVEYKSIIDLGNALDLLQYNLTVGNTKTKDSKEFKLLLDDWMIDGESSRVNIEEFKDKYLDVIKDISVKLEEIDNADKHYYIFNFYAIIVTLRSFVEVCHRR